jgi:hypothetical protein
MRISQVQDVYYGATPVKGYSFFDGNRHGGHPAHDIFIRDANQDCMDDATKKPAYAVAVLDGIVVSTYDSWRKGSRLRGGNYVWCYHPKERLFSYYAHLKEVFVQPGTKVAAGDSLGTIGRSGFSADVQRSPTHLHLMLLSYEGGELVPFNYYANLKKSASNQVIH